MGPEFDRYGGMKLHSSMLRNMAPFSLALVMLACGDKGGGTDSDSQGTGGGSSTTAVVPTSGAATDGGATDGGATAGGMSDGVSETGAPGSTTEPTTGGGAPELMTSCTDACAHIFECVMDLPGTMEDCVAGCLDQWGGPGCGQAGVDLLECLKGMNCKQLAAYVEQDKAGACAEAADAADAVCGGGGGTCSMIGSAGMNECSVGQECGGVVEELQCDGTTCTCVVDGEPGATCPDEGVCAETLEGQISAAQACCGFAW